MKSLVGYRGRKLTCNRKNNMPKLTILTDEKQDIMLGTLNPVGRHSSNKIQIHDPMISNSHCLISVSKEKGTVLKDLGSRNGTWVNQQQVYDQVVLNDGDEILLGNTHLIYNADKLTTAKHMVQVAGGQQAQQIHARTAKPRESRFLRECDITDEKVLRADYEKLRVTYELQRDIGLELDIDRMLSRILDRTSEFLNYDRGVILLVDGDGELVPRAYKTSDPDNKVTLSSTLIQQVQKEKIGVLSSDALTDERFDGSQSIVIQGIRSTLAVPILHKEELLGIMIVDSLVHVDAYTEKDLHLLTNIAVQSGQFVKNSQMAGKIENDAATRERFQRLLSPALAELVVSGKLKVEKGGTDQVATVLFADIRGFTAMSENMPAREILKILNDYFELIVDKVFLHEGTVDKFIGDEIMVIWGAPIQHHDDPVRAVKAAGDIQSVIAEFNRTNEKLGKPGIQVGIGINTGNLVAGYIGSSQTMSYSVIGDTVNTAARLCSAAKAGEILISRNTMEQVKEVVALQELDPIKVKGKLHPVDVFLVLWEDDIKEVLI